MMIKSCVKWPVILCVAALVAQASPAQAEAIYRNAEGHFSMIVPEGWEELSQTDLHEMADKTASVTEAAPLTIFQKRIGEGYARIDVSIHDVGRVSESELQEFTKGTDRQKAVSPAPDVQPANNVKEFFNKLEADEFVYERTRNVLFLKHQGGRKKNKVMIALNAELFSNYGYAVLTLYCSEPDIQNYYEDYDQILSSFRFDQGYQY